MKKILGISLVALFAVAPMMANAAPLGTVAKAGTNGTVSANTDVASTSYVQGAYNVLAGEIDADRVVINKLNGDAQTEGSVAYEAAARAAADTAINDKIGSADMGTSATTLTGAIAEINGAVSSLGTTSTEAIATAKTEAISAAEGYTDSKITALSSVYDEAGAAASAASGVETKLGAGDSGYDIDAKTLKVGGSKVATETYADGKASAAQTAAIDYTDGQIAALSSVYDEAGAAASAASGVETKLGAGDSGYDIDAKTLKVGGSTVATETYADGKASAAQTAAEATAAADATSKANAAETAAKSYADAKTLTVFTTWNTASSSAVHLNNPTQSNSLAS